MASSEREPMDVTFSEGNLYEQASDRKKFKPLRAIRKMFRGKKKSKDFSKSTGSIYTGPGSSSDSMMPPPTLMHSLSHESVFTPEGIIPVPGSTSVRHALSADDIGLATIPINRLKEMDGPDSAKAMSIGSDVNKSSGNLKTNGADIDLNLDMNDIAVNVSRLDNRAAYDKIALRPKRRTARKARGAPQQHVIKVQAEINGFSDTIEEDDEVKDIAPPEAKKPRPPSLFPPIADESTISSVEKNAATPKRHSMLGRSPMGPGPGMVVPSLADVKNIKLRKRQTDENVKPQEKMDTSLPKVKQDSKPTEKSKTSKTSDGVTKKGAKQERKISSEGASSIFPWKNKSSTPKSPQLTRSEKNDAKESGKTKSSSSMFPALKPTKKNSTEKEPKLNTSSEDKKETAPKKKTFGLGKRDKNRSGNNSKTNEVESVSESSNEVQIDQERVKSSSPEKEREDDAKEKGDKKDEKNVVIEEGSKSRESADDNKVKVKKNRYADKLKLEAAKLAENRVEGEESPSSPKSPSDDKKKPLIAPKSPTKLVKVDEVMKDVNEGEKHKSLEPGSPVKKIPTKLKDGDEVKKDGNEEKKIKTLEPSSPVKKNVSLFNKSPTEKPASPPNEIQNIRFPHLKPITTPRKVQKSLSEEKENLEILTEKNDKKDLQPVIDVPGEKSQESSFEKKEENIEVEKKVTPVHSPNTDKTPVVSNVVQDEQKKTVAVSPTETKTDKPKTESPLEPKEGPEESVTATKTEDKKPVTTSAEAVHRFETKSSKNDSPAGALYSRSMLKPVGGNKSSQSTRVPERKIASFKESSPTSPSRALRTRSFNVGSVTPTGDKPVTPKSETIEEVATKKRSFSQPPNPSPISEKPRLAAKPPITPNRTLVINEKATIQDAENNNIEKKDVLKDKVAEMEKPVPRRRNVKSETNADEKDVPDWVKLARRRSRNWDEGKKSNSTVTRQHSVGSDRPKDSDRPKTLAVASSKPSRPLSGDVKTVTPTSVTKTPTSMTKAPTSVPKTPTSAKETQPVSQKTALFQTNKTTGHTETKAAAPTNTAKNPSSKRGDIVISEKSPSDDTSTKGQVSRTASIPKIDKVSPRKVNAPKQVTPPGQPSWLAIAMQKQKSWAKEETV